MFFVRRNKLTICLPAFNFDFLIITKILHCKAKYESSPEGSIKVPFNDYLVKINDKVGIFTVGKIKCNFSN